MEVSYVVFEVYTVLLECFASIKHYFANFAMVDQFTTLKSTKNLN